MSMPLGLTRKLLKRKEEKSFLERQKEESDQVLERILKQWSSQASLHISSTDVIMCLNCFTKPHSTSTDIVPWWSVNTKIMAMGGISNLLL